MPAHHDRPATGEAPSRRAAADGRAARLRVVAVAAAALVAAGCAPTPTHEPAPPTGAPPVRLDAVAPRELGRAIDLAGQYLVRHCDADGRFHYWLHTDPDFDLPPAYNVLRHSGTIYALGMYADLRNDPDAVAAMRRAAGLLRRETIDPITGMDEICAVWSGRLSDEADWDRPRAKLGGTGLGLVALLSLERHDPGQTDEATLRRLGNFLLYMQRRDGSFYTEYQGFQHGRSGAWTSLYYPGEAALGLVMLGEHTGERRWIDAAVAALRYLASIRPDVQSTPPDHWALIATERVLPLLAESRTADRAELLRHAELVCGAMLARLERVDAPPDSPLHGCFTPDGRTCPTSTCLEGLQAALGFLPPERRALRARIASAVDAGVAFLVRSQIRDGRLAGGWPRAIAPIPADSARDRRFNRRVDEVRIDYVQHALSALIRCRRLRR